MKRESKQLIIINIGFFFLFIIDRVSKWWAYNQLSENDPIHFFSILRLELYMNKGVIFSIPLYQPLIYIITIVILSVVITYLYKSYKNFNKCFIIGFSLIAIGAFSNLLDRINYGVIIDFVNLIFLPIFNLADVLIVIGTVILIIKIPHEKKNEKVQ